MLTAGVPAFRCLAVLVAASLIAACESTPGPADDPSPLGPPPAPVGSDPLSRLDSFAPDREAWARVGYRLDWRSVPPLGRGDRFTVLDLLGEHIAVQSNDSSLSLLDPATGAIRNTSQLADRLATLTGNLRVGPYVVSSTSYDAFFVEPVTGNLVDRQTYPGVLASRPSTVGGLLIGATSDGLLFAQTPASGGFLLWRFGTREPIRTDPLLVGPSVAAVTDAGTLVLLDTASGRLIGTSSMFEGPGASLTASDSEVYVASRDQSIYAFSTLDARMLWRVRTGAPLRQQPTLADGVLYVATDDRGLLALDAATGAELWAASLVRGRVIAERNGRLVAWDGVTATILDPTTGDVADAAELPGIRMLRAAEFADGDLFAVSDHGVVAKFVPWQ